MNKQKMKNLFKLGILIFGISLFFTNCQKDDTIIQQNTENNTFLSKVKQKSIAFDNLKSDTKLYQIFEQTLDNSKNETVKKLSNKSKTTNNTSQFSSNVTKSTLGNYTAYTIPVKNTTGDLSSFQNIVIEADNVREASYLITYYPDETYQEFIRLGYIRDGANIDFSGSSKIEILYYKGKVPNVSKVPSTNKSNQSKGSLSQKTSGDVTCYISCFTVHTPPHNCTAGGNHTPDEIDECNGSSGQLPSAGEIQAYCFEYGCTTEGGGPSDGSGTSPEGGTTGGSSPFEPVPTPDDWTPENICIRTDPINGNCIETEPYNPIISRPDVPYTENDFEKDENSYTLDTYPGKDDGLSFNWWNDEDFVKNNIVLNVDDEGISDLSDAEILLVALYPAQALIIQANVDDAQTETINRFGFNGRNDKSDAFRHAFFNAMNSNDAGDTVARLFSTAHESEVPAHLTLEVQMDLHNNDQGHTVGDDASFFVSDQELSDSVFQILLDGQLFYLSPLKAVVPPNFGINSSTQLTPTDQ